MIVPRPYQEISLQLLYEYFMSNKGNPLIAYPTGTGKSLIPALFIHRVMQRWPSQRFLLITHVKELIEQNVDVISKVWPNVPLGIYSAGLKQKDIVLPIIYGGIQSMIKNPALFGWRDIIFIDEAHLVSMDEASSYLTFIAVMKAINPNIKIIGLTATPYRMGQGMLMDEGGLFTDIVHDLTGIEEFNKLIAQGYLCPPVALHTKTALDVSNVGMSKGDFVLKQLQLSADIQETTHKALKELIAVGENRRSWLNFASGIEHAEHIAEMLRSFGIDCAAVHSKQHPDFNDKAIKAFKEGKLRAITNFGKLTTGFNHEPIDLIGMFRPTMSVPLWVQMLGRGTRPFENSQYKKINCLVMDYGRNSQRLGPINDPFIPKRKESMNGEVPIKICDVCGAYNHVRVKLCVQCGNEFEFQNKLISKASNDAVLRSDIPIVEIYNVDRAIYAPHNKKGSPTSMKVTYFCGMQMFREFVCLEHPGYAKKIAHDWWKMRHKSNPPLTVNEASHYIQQLKVPRKLRVWVNKKHPEIVGVEF